MPAKNSKLKKRPKRPSLPSLIAKADKLTSEYIRRKNAGHDGLVKCVSCDTVIHWKEAHCAHWMPRAAKATRWMEENLSAACASCNVFRVEMHQREFTLFQLDRFGRDGIEEIKDLSKKVLSASQVRALAEEAIKEFGAALKDMESK
jgi:hypothetical protein